MMSESHALGTTKRARKPWRWVIFFALIGVGGLILYRGWASSEKRSASQRVGRGDIPVEISPVVHQHLTYSLVANGDIAPLMQVDLYAKVSGYLEKISVQIGDSVRQGQVIAQIDRAEFVQKVKEVEAKVAQAKAQVAELEAGTRAEDVREAEEAVKQAQSRFNNAKLQRERVEALYKREVISKKEFDISEMDYNVTEAQLAAAEQHLKMLKEGARPEVKAASLGKLKEMEAILAQEQIRLQNTEIVAPFPGEIVRRNVDNGALVSPSTPLVTLVHMETLKVLANVLEKDIALVKPGMKAKILTETYPEKPFEGTIVRINKALDLGTRTLQTEINVPNPGRLLKPGMFARIEVTLTDKPDALAIPKEAVLEEGGKQAVFVVEGNQALRKPVVTGIEQGPFIEVVEGLKDGEKVVVRGQESLRDRSTILVVEGS
ncbi:MAG: efflux RND transporter periplasmic adaptor subunit [Desulfobacterales bacterium]|nr:efflux RND transporter periplasmic adaptor subunit [Desulfobacterales bacterium]